MRSKAPLHRWHKWLRCDAGGSLPAASEKLALPKMGIGAWAWGDSLFWGYDPKEDEELEKVFSFVAARKDGFVDTAGASGLGDRSRSWDNSRSATAR